MANVHSGGNNDSEIINLITLLATALVLGVVALGWCVSFVARLIIDTLRGEK